MANDVNVELVGLLKDIRDYFALQDAEQEKAKIDKPPKIAETQKKISGGSAPAGMRPAAGIAKQMVPASTEGTSVGENSFSVEGTEATALKAVDFEEEKVDEVPEDEVPATEESSESLEDAEEIPEKLEGDVELKSLLKDIKDLLSKNIVLEKSVAELQKSMDSKIKKGIDLGMRKLGFATTKPSVSRYGVDEPLKKSADAEVKAESDSAEKVEALVTDMSKKSWVELGSLREASGDLNLFPMYRPTRK